MYLDMCTFHRTWVILTIGLLICVTQGKPMPANQIQKQQCENNHELRYPVVDSNCTRFFKCHKTCSGKLVIIEQSCPVGSLFDVKLNICKRDFQVMCSVNGGWAAWTTWSGCTCDSQSRSRTCTNPSPQHGGASCSGSDSESQSCSSTYCPIDGAWTAWAPWSMCTLTCGTGTQTRSRTCTNPSPQYNGVQCPHNSDDSQDCNTHNCPIDGAWTAWAPWSMCTLTCGTGTRTRTRTCTNPSPQYNGAQCPHNSDDSQDCNTHNCPIDGAWTAWAPWSMCTLTCGTGTRTRTRTCTNPSPQYNGAQCPNNPDGSQYCNTHNCPSNNS